MATASWLDPTTRQARLWKKHDLLALPHTVHKLEVALLLPVPRACEALAVRGAWGAAPRGASCVRFDGLPPRARGPDLC
jgi:hypothetical protein